jgi:hypothetical protein
MELAAVRAPINPTGYRREARRIRARYAGRPSAMQAALRGLADRADRRAWRSRFLPAGTVAKALEDGFAGYVSERISAGPFTFSDRMEALQSAERIGIPRFKANLIVALTQSAAADRPVGSRPVGRRSPVGALLTAVILIEAAIAGIFYSCL